MNPRHQHSGPGMSVAVYQTWEIRNFLLQTETPGKHGYFTAEAANA